MYLIFTRFGENCNKRYILEIRSPISFFQIPSFYWKQKNPKGWRFGIRFKKFFGFYPEIKREDL